MTANETAASASVTAPNTFKITSIIFLLWNLMGLAAFAAHISMGDEAIAALPEAQRQLYLSTPAWADAAFGLAVVAGTLGCIFLLMRRVWAVPTFIASLIGVVVQMVHGFLIADTLEVMGPTALILPTLVTAAAIFLVIYSRKAAAESWIA